MPRSRLIAAVVMAVVAGSAGPLQGQAQGSTATSADATASVSGATATLATSAVRRTWALGTAGARTTSLRDLVSGTEWSAPGSNDVTLSLGGVPLTSASLTMISVTASTAPGDPRIPGAPAGARLAFRYTAGVPGLELQRDYTAHPRSGVIEVDTRLINRTPAAARVSAFSLDEVTSLSQLIPEVQRYVGGSDWRSDFRGSSSPAVPFDAEGEVLRLDGGAGGWFMVSERRGGDMSRVGRDASGRSWVGVDYQRDLFDYGPLMSSPPNYNRLPNPTSEDWTSSVESGC